MDKITVGLVMIGAWSFACANPAGHPQTPPLPEALDAVPELPVVHEEIPDPPQTPPTAQPETIATESPDGTIAVAFDGITFRYRADDLGPVAGTIIEGRPLRDPTHKPDSVFPRHHLLRFASEGDLTDPYAAPRLAVYPIDGFTWAYAVAPEQAAEVARNIKAVEAVAAGRARLRAETLLPVPFVDASASFIARTHPLSFASGKGFAVLTQFVIEPEVVDTDDLLYLAQGVTSDGQYVLLEIPVTTSLVASHNDSWTLPLEEEASYRAYFDKLASTLDGAPATAFHPDLDALDRLFQSITVR